jgi:hypothetical protein
MHMRMSNFLDPEQALTVREIHYNPHSHKERERVRVIRDRARNMGIEYQIVSVPGRGNKIIIAGPRALIMRAFNPRYTASTRRRSHSSSGRRSSTRRRNRS